MVGINSDTIGWNSYGARPWDFHREMFGCERLQKIPRIADLRRPSFLHATAQTDMVLDAGTNPEADIAQLIALPGIGQWTAHYIAMRASRWPDAFPKEDIAVRNSLGGVNAKQAEEISQAWRPWRSYAVMHLWKNPRNRGDQSAPSRALVAASKKKRVT